jgi:8-oxo-dGTP pyrophosphatase MutT (NUDIX family)
MDDDHASREHGLAAGGLALRVAAARECFEEAGILLARDPVSSQRVALDEARSPALDRWRDRLNDGSATFLDLLAAEDLVLDARDLHLFSHWLTPVGAPRRYNTWFFVAAAPKGHEGMHDDNELVASAWMRPPDALDACARGEIELVFPTLRTLQVLAPYPTARALLVDIDRAPRDEHGPLVLRDSNGERIVLPDDDPRDAVRWTIPLPDINHRDEIALAEQYAPTPARASEQGTG